MSLRAARSSRGPASPRPARDVTRLSPYAAPATGRRGFLRLDLNENLRGCAPGVVERLRSIGAEDLTLYPEETGARAAVARRFGIAPPLDLVLCAGADEGIRLVCDAFVERGERTVIIEPSYPLYRFYATLAGARVVAATCAEDLSFPERALSEEVARGCRLLILGDPNNPTGRPLPDRLVEEVALRHPETVILLDEAYAEFSGRSSVPLLGRFPNLIVARTFSKAYGLAGLRAGVLLGHAQTVAWPARIRSPYAVGHLALLAVEAALADEGFVERYVAEVRRARGLLTRGLRSLGVPCVPSAANFLIARFGPAAQAIRRGLAQRRILVRDRSDQAGLRGTLRIGIGTEEQATATLAAVRGALAELRGAAS